MTKIEECPSEGFLGLHTRFSACICVLLDLVLIRLVRSEFHFECYLLCTTCSSPLPFCVLVFFSFLKRGSRGLLLFMILAGPRLLLGFFFLHPLLHTNIHMVGPYC